MLLAVLLVALSTLSSGASVTVLSRANAGRPLPWLGRPEQRSRPALALGLVGALCAAGAFVRLSDLGLDDEVALLLAWPGPLVASIAVQVRHDARLARAGR